VFRLGLSSLLMRDTGSAVKHAVAIENGQVHQRVVDNVGDERGERLSSVDMAKRTPPVRLKAGEFWSC
jgi:hypothetical protein